MRTAIVLIITLSLVVLWFSLIPSAFAWNDCPFGLKNDPYPGQCPKYVDTNQNGICDHSEDPPADTSNTTSDTNRMPLMAVIISLATLLLVALAEVLRRRQGGLVCWIVNVILTILFIISGISGYLLIFAPSQTQLQIHILSSLPMFIIGLYHIWRHIPYYKVIPTKGR